MPNKKSKPTKQRKQKSKPKNWKLKADNLWSLIIRKHYQRCEICDRPGKKTKSGFKIGGLIAHHLISRGILLWRHNLRNGVCLCTYCHLFHKTCSPHGGTITAMRGFMKWMEENKPKQWAWFEEHELEHRTPKYTYEETAKYLQEKLNNNSLPPYDV